MNITIKVNRDEVEDIIKKHVLEEVQVPTAGKKIYMSNIYGTYKIEITDKGGE